MGDPIWSLVASNAVSNTSRSTAQTSATSASQAPGGLGKDAFMRLLLTQMQSQDPLSPMDGQAFFTQLAQLSLLEQMYQLNDTLQTAQREQQLVQAGSLIGREIEAVAPDGSSMTGIVKGVRMSKGEVLLDVNGADVPLNLVASIRNKEAAE